MNDIREDINPNLEEIYSYFDRFCKENGCFFDIASDEADQQGYVLKDHSLTEKLTEYIGPKAAELGVHVDVDPNRKDGILFTFTLESIADDGHWRPLSKKRKREEFSPFANPKDARTVRHGKSLAHLGDGKGDKISHPVEEIHRILDDLMEGDEHIPTVAVDLDGTLAKIDKKYDDKAIPDPRPGAKKALDELNEMGCRIIINTVRGDEKLVRDWCYKHDIHFDYINKNPDQPKGSSDKIIADVYIDDRAEDGSKNWSDIIDAVKKRLNEDQYKYPNRRKHRGFSPYRSSFGKSKSFGGITEAAGAIAGSSIPVYIEPSSNAGIVPPDRTTHKDGPSQKLRSYKTRTDLTDIPTEAPPDQEFDIAQYLSKLLDELNAGLQERTEPSARAGRPRDNQKRTLTGKRMVPLATARAGQIQRSDDDDQMLMPAEDMDDEATREREDPTRVWTKKIPNLRPLGLFGPGDQRQPATRPASNVRVQHPPDRSFDASFPSITVPGQSWGTTNLENGDTEGSDPLTYQKPVGNLAKAIERRLKQFDECLGRPEDGYDFMQRLIAELRMVTVARKFREFDRVWVRACDGEVSLEVEHKSDGFSGGPGKLLVYKHGRLLREMDIDLSKNTVVLDTAEIIREMVK